MATEPSRKPATGMMSPAYRGLVWVGLGIGGLLVAGYLGYRLGQVDAQAIVDALQSRASELQSQNQQVVDQLQSNIDQLSRASKVAEARSAALQSTLDESMKQSMDDADELALYRRIAGGDEASGLVVDKVELVGDSLQITLVQFRGRNRASGAIGVSFAGVHDGDYRRWVVIDARTGALERVVIGNERIADPAGQLKGQAPDGRWRMEVDTTIPFDLRFFQTLLVKAGNITSIEPEFVDVVIQPDGKGQKRSYQRFSWSDVHRSR